MKMRSYEKRRFRSYSTGKQGMSVLLPLIASSAFVDTKHSRQAMRMDSHTALAAALVGEHPKPFEQLLMKLAVQNTNAFKKGGIL